MKKTSSQKPAWTRVLGIIFYVGLLGLALAVGTVAGVIRRSPLALQIFTSGLFHVKPQDVFEKKDSLTLLILGCDEDRFDGDTRLHGSRVSKKYSRADMILVAKLDFKNSTVTGISVPRDTECTLPGYGRHKINAFHNIVKPDKADKVQELAVEKILPGVDVDRVVVLNYEAFQQLVDAVGGVDLTVPKAMKYDDYAGDLHINFQPGPQHLNGYQAMGYVRYRHDTESDFGRQQRQKDFLLAFKASAIHSWLRLPEIAEMGKTAMNNALSDREIAALAFFARGVQPSQIRMGMLPVREVRGTTYLRVDKRKVHDVLVEYNLLSDSAQIR